jgi:hypothetical protein
VKESNRSISALQNASKAEQEELGKVTQELKAARKTIGKLQNENEAMASAV